MPELGDEVELTVEDTVWLEFIPLESDEETGLVAEKLNRLDGILCVAVDDVPVPTREIAELLSG